MAALIFGHPVIGIYKFLHQQSIRLYTVCNLIFFVSGLLVSCHRSDETNLALRWHDKRATGLAIPLRLVSNIRADSLDQVLSIRLAGKETTIAGSFQTVNNEVIFEPLVPFTRGLHYTVWARGKQLGDITIPTLDATDRPALLAIYPTQDSLPDNLLKIYLRFSRPMREGQSQQYITLLKNNTDTLSGVFLDLQPELWNADRTLLTLWLDPGRIKRDLQPNKLLGAPLQIGGHYQLVISVNWPDQQGALLRKSQTKTFLTVQRDSLSPIPSAWSIQQPKSGSVQPLSIAFGEALDYSLLTETLTILDKAGKPVSGAWQLGDEEKQVFFNPTNPWQSGTYRLQIETRLEDLAGNNINRPFDRDITSKGTKAGTQRVIERNFNVE